MLEVYAMNPGDLDRRGYKKVREVAEEICDWVEENGPATLSLNDNWWAKAIISPWVGRAVNRSIGFSPFFDQDELLILMEKEGYYFSPFEGYPLVGVVDSIRHTTVSCMSTTEVLV